MLERNRRVVIPAAHGGEPCEEMEEESACDIQSCDVDCELSAWSSWGTCTKACDGGTQRRMKTIQQPAHGAGACWEEDDDKRLEFKDCNTYSCQDMLVQEGRETLYCNSEVDVVIVLDGSASLRSRGWEMSTEIGEKLVRALNGTANVAFEVFSGPNNWNSYKMCTGKSRGTPNMETDCGITWVSHFKDNMPVEELATKVEHGTLTWPRSTTLTSAALGQAEAEIITGREEVNSVVIVITDGWPMSQKNTKEAAKKLQKKAKVVWVPVGRYAPRRLIKKMAQKPWQDHVISVEAFSDLQMPETLNRIITSTCPVVG